MAERDYRSTECHGDKLGIWISSGLIITGLHTALNLKTIFFLPKNSSKFFGTLPGVPLYAEPWLNNPHTGEKPQPCDYLLIQSNVVHRMLKTIQRGLKKRSEYSI